MLINDDTIKYSQSCIDAMRTNCMIINHACKDCDQSFDDAIDAMRAHAIIMHDDQWNLIIGCEGFFEIDEMRDAIFEDRNDAFIMIED